MTQIKDWQNPLKKEKDDAETKMFAKPRSPSQAHFRKFSSAAWFL